jgi:hypothetical protein
LSSVKGKGACPDIPDSSVDFTQFIPRYLELDLLQSHLPRDNATQCMHSHDFDFSFHQVPITAG